MQNLSAALCLYSGEKAAAAVISRQLLFGSLSTFPWHFTGKGQEGWPVLTVRPANKSWRIRQVKAPRWPLFHLTKDFPHHSFVLFFQVCSFSTQRHWYEYCLYRDYSYCSNKRCTYMFSFSLQSCPVYLFKLKCNTESVTFQSLPAMLSWHSSLLHTGGVLSKVEAPLATLIWPCWHLWHVCFPLMLLMMRHTRH